MLGKKPTTLEESGEKRGVLLAGAQGTLFGRGGKANAMTVSPAKLSACLPSLLPLPTLLFVVGGDWGVVMLLRASCVDSKHGERGGGGDLVT